MDLSPRTTLPFPGDPGFEQLPAAERLWLEQVQDWYLRGKRAPTPQRVAEHPTMAMFHANPARHMPFLVKYFRADPMLFSMALRLLTQSDVEGPTIEACQQAWAQKISACAA